MVQVLGRPKKKTQIPSNPYRQEETLEKGGGGHHIYGSPPGGARKQFDVKLGPSSRRKKNMGG